MSKNDIKLVDITAIIGTIAIGMTTAFAVSSSSTGPWYTLQEIPSRSSGACSFVDYKCADATSSGENSLVSRGDNFAWNVATARNNMQKDPHDQGSNPELTTSASTIKYKIKVQYKGTHDIAIGHIGWYQYGGDLMKQSGSNWAKYGGCYSAVYGDGTKQGTTTKTCSRPNSGTNTFQIGAQHQTTAPAYILGSDDVLNYYSGSNHASTERLELCTNC